MEKPSNYATSRTSSGPSRQPQTPSQMARTGPAYFQAEPAKIPPNYRKRTAMQAEQIKELQVS